MEPLCHGWPLAPTSIDHHSIMDVSLHQDASHCDMSACVGPVDDHITDPLRYLGTVVLPFHGNRTSKIVLVLKSQTPSSSTTCRPPCSHTECGGDISGRGIFLLIPPPPPPPPPPRTAATSFGFVLQANTLRARAGCTICKSLCCQTGGMPFIRRSLYKLDSGLDCAQFCTAAPHWPMGVTRLWTMDWTIWTASNSYVAARSTG